MGGLLQIVKLSDLIHGISPVGIETGMLIDISG